MGRLGSAFRIVLSLPPVWIALMALGLVVVTSGWDPIIDILTYAVVRLFG